LAGGDEPPACEMTIERTFIKHQPIAEKAWCHDDESTGQPLAQSGTDRAPRRGNESASGKGAGPEYRRR